jgi:hypothetical protein
MPPKASHAFFGGEGIKAAGYGWRLSWTRI